MKRSDMIPLIGIAVVTACVMSPLLSSFTLSANDFDLLGSFQDLPIDFRWKSLIPRLEFSVLLQAMGRCLFMVFGVDGHKYAVFNLTLHAANCLLVYLLTRRIASPLCAVLAAAFFAVAPSHVGTVAHLWKILMKGGATFFGLQSLLLFFRFLETRRASFYAASIAAFVCSLLCNEVSITMLLIGPLWLVHHEPHSRQFDRSGWLRASLPFLGVTLVYLILEFAVYLKSMATFPYNPEGYRVGWHTVSNLIGYLSILVNATDRQEAAATWWAAFLLITALLGLGLRNVAGPVRRLSVVSILLGLLPVLPFLRLDSQLMGEYSYFGSVFFSITLGLAAGSSRFFLRTALVCSLLLIWGKRTYALSDHARVQMKPLEVCLDSLHDAICAPGVPRTERKLEVILEHDRYFLSEYRLKQYLKGRCQDQALEVRILSAPSSPETGPGVLICSF